MMHASKVSIYTSKEHIATILQMASRHVKEEVSDAELCLLAVYGVIYLKRDGTYCTA